MDMERKKKKKKEDSHAFALQATPNVPSSCVTQKVALWSNVDKSPSNSSRHDDSI